MPAEAFQNQRKRPKIGIGGRLATPPLPHHRAYGFVPRRFDRVKLLRRQGRHSILKRYRAPKAQIENEASVSLTTGYTFHFRGYTPASPNVWWTTPTSNLNAGIASRSRSVPYEQNIETTTDELHQIVIRSTGAHAMKRKAPANPTSQAPTTDYPLLALRGSTFK